MNRDAMVMIFCIFLITGFAVVGVFAVRWGAYGVLVPLVIGIFIATKVIVNIYEDKR